MFLLRFVGLLRTGEIVSLKRCHLQLLGGGSISLPDSKGAERSGLLESVATKHHLTHASLGRDLTRIALAIGLKHPNLTPCSLRRGDATLLFKGTLNYDYVQDHCRCPQSKTCRIYINQVMADLGQHTLPQWGINRLSTCVKDFDQVLTSFIETGLLI